jgi:hypothetical protein
MSGIFYTRSEFTAPWGLALPAMQDYLMFHVVTSGRCSYCQGALRQKAAYILMVIASPASDSDGAFERLNV